MILSLWILGRSVCHPWSISIVNELRDICSIAAFRRCTLAGWPANVHKPIPGRICEESIRRRGPLYFGPGAESFSLGSCCRSCIFGAGDIEVWLGPGTCPPKILVKSCICQKNWQAGRRILISHQMWHHDTKWRDPQELHAKGQKGDTFLSLEILEVSRSGVFREPLVFTFDHGRWRCHQMHGCLFLALG